MSLRTFVNITPAWMEVHDNVLKWIFFWLNCVIIILVAVLFMSHILTRRD